MDQIAKQKVLAVVVAAALLAVGLFWTLSRSDTLGEMKLLVGTGSATIQRGEEALPIDAGEPADIRPGDVVSTAPDSHATIRLEGDRHLVVAEKSSIEILGPASAESVSGTLIARSTSALKVSIGDTVARARNARFRVDRGAGTTRAGVHRGSVDLTAPGSPNLRLDALWQTTLVADRIYDSEPYRLDADDPWDQQFLDDIVELDGRLEAMREFYIGEVAGTAPTLAYFDTQAKDNVGFMRRYVRELSPKKPGYTADIMINFFLAKHADGPTAKNFHDGFRYFRQGATWGVAGGLLGFTSKDKWNSAVKDLRVALYGTSGVGGSGGEGPSFAIAGEEATDGGSVDGAPTGGAPGTDGDDGDDPAPPPDDPPDPPDPPDPTDSPDPTPPPPCDVQCEVEKIIQPSPDPTNLGNPPPIGR